jgi:hypothetical protein
MKNNSRGELITRRALLLAAAAVPASTGMIASASHQPVALRDFYMRDGSLSDFAREAEGTRVTVDGFMAPPLKAEANFFVLTKIPMSVCPFCSSAAEWPDDILAVYTKRTVDVVPYDRRIETRGILELGEYKDPETGFVSLLRLADSTYA